MTVLTSEGRGEEGHWDLGSEGKLSSLLDNTRPTSLHDLSLNDFSTRWCVLSDASPRRLPPSISVLQINRRFVPDQNLTLIECTQPEDRATISHAENITFNDVLNTLYLQLYGV